MRTIIAGSRTITSLEHVANAMAQCGFFPSTVISGTAKGVDKLGEEWAALAELPIERYPANWEKYGRRAGYVRNEEMANVADALVAIWDGSSKGTAHMIDIARKKGLTVFVLIIDTATVR